MRRPADQLTLGWVLLAAVSGCEDTSSRDLQGVLSASGPAATAPQEDAAADEKDEQVVSPARGVRARPGARLLAFRRGWVEWLHSAGGGTEIRFLNAAGGPLKEIQAAHLWLAGRDGPQAIALAPGPGEGIMRPVEPIAEAFPQGVLRFALGDEVHRVALPIAATSGPSASATAEGS